MSIYRAVLFLFLIFTKVFPVSELKVVTEAHRGAVGRVSSDRDGRIFLTCSVDKSAKIWDNGGRLLRTLYPPSGNGHKGVLYAGALSADGALAALGARNVRENPPFYSVYLFSTSTGVLISLSEGLSQPIADLKFSHNGKYLAAGLLGSGGVVIFGVDSLRKIAQMKGFQGDVAGCDFDRSGRLVVAGIDGSVRLFGSQFQEEAFFSLPQGAVPLSVAFSPDGGEVALGLHNGGGVFFLDAFSLRKKGFLSGAPKSFMTLVSYEQRSGSFRAMCTENQHRVVLFNGEGKSTYLSGVRGPVYDFEILGDNSSLFSGLNGFGRVDQWGNVLFYHGNQMLNFSQITPCGFNVSSNGMRVNFELDGLPPLLFSIQERLLIRSDLGFVTGIVKKCNESRKVSFDIPGGHKILSKVESDSLVLVGTNWNLYCFTKGGLKVWRKHLHSAVYALDIAQEAGLGVFAMGDGTVRWVSLHDGADVYTLFVREDLREWVMWTRGNHWEASKNGSSLLRWFTPQGGKREELVSDVNMFHLEKSGLPKFHFQEEKTERVSLGIVNLRDQDTVKDTLVVLEVSISDGGSLPVVSLGLEVNGAVQMTTYRGLVPGKSRDIRNIPVILSRGKNRVVLKAYTNDYQVTRQLDIICKPPSDETIKKPLLNVLLAGISVYRNPDLALDYGARDAIELSRELLRQGGGLYRQVGMKLLIDSTATREAIFEGMEWLKRGSQGRDVSVVFLAGHGIYDSERKAYFVPYEGDTGKLRRSCIPFSELRWYVERIPGKVILFLDACYSGVIASRVRTSFSDLEGAVRELVSGEAGCVIFSSSSANQFAQEDRVWGSSAFAKALLEGVRGKADMRGDGIITPAMLELYISERVKELTGGAQVPLVAKPYGVGDFPFVLTPELTGEVK